MAAWRYRISLLLLKFLYLQAAINILYVPLFLLPVCLLWCINSKQHHHHHHHHYYYSLPNTYNENSLPHYIALVQVCSVI